MCITVARPLVVFSLLTAEVVNLYIVYNDVSMLICINLQIIT